MKIEKVSIDKLLLDPANARKHGKKNLDSIKGSLAKFGQQKPIVVNADNVIVAGNGTLQAAKELGWKEINIVRTDLKGSDITAFGIADNRTSELAEWDDDVLKELLEGLKAEDFDLSAIGFDDDEFAELMGGKSKEGLTDADDVPEPPKVPITKMGDIWQLGNHRLMCGDSTDDKLIAILMNGKIADLWLTDPPYNVAIQGGNHGDPSRNNGLKIQNDKMGDETFVDFIKKACLSAKSALKDGGAFYIWHANNTSRLFQDAIHEAGLQVRQHLVWLKSSIVMGQQDYHYKHEPCLYGWKDGAGHFWGNDRKQTTILEFDKPSRNGVHPTMKPVDLFEYQICNNTKINGLVLDSFGGSGTTIIASEKAQRCARVMELDPIYCDVIVKRWEDFTGKKAELLSS
ncbi:MAG: DNA modification methylase [Candidatus Riflebacteria bacterium]|nr:DNA modification methylase [Candidatus Riflebacteria bacterium]